MIILINGARNAGKSTLAKSLTKSLSRTAHIEIDFLRHFLAGYGLEKTIPINLENAVLVTKNFVNKKYNVVLDYCLRDKDYRYLITKLKPLNVKVLTVTLKPNLKTALSNRGRPLTQNDKKRIKEQYGKGQHHIVEKGLIIDNTSKSPAEILKIVLSHLHNKPSPTKRYKSGT